MSVGMLSDIRIRVVFVVLLVMFVVPPLVSELRQLQRWYVRNAFLPTQLSEMQVIREPRLETRRYLKDEEGLFARKEHREVTQVSPWTPADGGARWWAPTSRTPHDRALVVEEKQHRALDYVVALRAGLTSLAAVATIYPCPVAP